MPKIELITPVMHILVNQEFGKNYLNFYQKWGLKGHNGLDLNIMTGCPIRAAHSGVVSFASTYNDGDKDNPVDRWMRHVEIWDKNNGYKTIYLHLQSYIVEEGDSVKAGQIIGYGDNTGVATTGPHLHFGLKLVDAVGSTINKSNGYNGAIDPAPYFIDKKWQETPAKRQYFRKRNLEIESRVMAELVRYLKRLPSHEQINACVYGGWDRETVANSAMRFIYAYLKKDEYTEKNMRPFLV